MDKFTPKNMFTINPSWDEIIEVKVKLKNLLIDYWITETVFTFNWWFLLITSIVFFIVWIKVLDKKRIIEISSFGLLVGTLTFLLDMIGDSLVLWSYPDRLGPFTSSIFEIHNIHIPIIYMIIYQYFNTWKSYFIALTISSFIFAFILEPITAWLGIYEIYHWKYMYSFPIYILGGVTLRWIIIKVKKIEKKYIRT
ncbi:CBO0543 family protein [Cytobacillus sp. FJAT-54145]|uniref:CBO0543 family protein n=1 Tax=Cytobacillus spartinae TaxID=3299023 RepID=A0ABW6K978_9BACI